VIQAGLNSEVEHRGRVFHVQTESLQRSAPVVETLIYSGGEILVRMTVSLAELAEQARLSGDDVRHALELQHWNLVRKVQHGMLGDDAALPVDATPKPQTRTTVTPADLAEGAEPTVRQLLDELKQRIGEAQRQSPMKPVTPAIVAGRNGPRRWWDRCTGRVSLVVRW
jgi:hypothetical protein